MIYRLVIEPATPHRARCLFSIEQRRETAPSWFPAGLAQWWMRWHPHTGKRPMSVANKTIARRGMIANIGNEEQLKAFKDRMSKNEGVEWP